MIKSHFKLLFLAIIVLFASCKDDDDATPVYDIPTTYNFENVSYSGQTQRLQMMTELKTYMKSANTSGIALDVARLKAMYENDAANAQWQLTYEDSKQIKGKTFEQVQGTFETLLENLAIASQSTVTGIDGQAGVVTSSNGEKNYLLDAQGVELGQVIEKGLMGALIYYQATGIYMAEDKMSGDNETVTDGKGTEMEHAWDEAFGYLGVPVDFPTSTDGIVFWGNYSNGRDAILGSNQKLMDALLKGRAAISNKDLATRDEAIDEARSEWELVVVGTALHYLNGTIEDFDDMALRAHQLSEALGFIYSIQFNPAKTINNTQVEELLNLTGGSTDLTQANLYNADLSKIEQARDELAAYYNLTDKKGDF